MLLLSTTTVRLYDLTTWSGTGTSDSGGSRSASATFTQNGIFVLGTLPTNSECFGDLTVGGLHSAPTDLFTGIAAADGVRVFLDAYVETRRITGRCYGALGGGDCADNFDKLTLVFRLGIRS